MEGLYDTQVTLLQRALDFRTDRHNVLASNIANVETPGFKAKDLVFERALGAALKAQEPGPLTVTHPKHMDGRDITALEMVVPKQIRATSPVGSVDGNTVDLEREMAKLAENQIVYQFMTRMISSKFQTLRDVIREGE